MNKSDFTVPKKDPSRKDLILTYSQNGTHNNTRFTIEPEFHAQFAREPVIVEGGLLTQNYGMNYEVLRNVSTTCLQIDVPGIFTEPGKARVVQKKLNNFEHSYTLKQNQGQLAMTVFLAPSGRTPVGVALKVTRPDAAQQLETFGMSRVFSSKTLFGTSEFFINLEDVQQTDFFQDSACVLRDYSVVSLRLSHQAHEGEGLTDVQLAHVPKQAAA